MADEPEIQEEKKKEIRCDVVKVIQETETRRGKLRLQIVKWNGRKASLEKREYWIDENDNDKEKPGKNKGLNLEDFHTLIANQEEISKLLAN